MGVVKIRRSRMVSFRLTEAEFQALHKVCEKFGSRSVSDLARDAVFNLVGPTVWANNVVQDSAQDGAFDGLNTRLQELDREIKRLTGLMTLDGKMKEMGQEVKRLASLLGERASL